jgi:hypothetical protein
MMSSVLAGDRDRDRAAASLRRHYVGGRLSFEEFSHRMQLAVAARSREDVRAALRDLPLGWDDMPDGFRTAVRSAGRLAARGVLFLALAGVWFMFSLILLIAFAIALAVDGPSLVEVIAFPLVWLLGTYGLLRVWQRDGRRA